MDSILQPYFRFCRWHPSRSGSVVLTALRKYDVLSVWPKEAASRMIDLLGAIEGNWGREWLPLRSKVREMIPVELSLV